VVVVVEPLIIVDVDTVFVVVVGANNLDITTLAG
jgi:hypothetical protein